MNLINQTLKKWKVFCHGRVLAVLVWMMMGSFVWGNGTDAEGPIKPATSGVVPQPVGLSDWPALNRALKTPVTNEGRIVSFRELWGAGPELADESLLIQGVVYRRFRRAATGQFPALEELWIQTDDDGLVVVTNRQKGQPGVAKGDETSIGAKVAVQGLFLRLIQYEAKDEPRIAPWIVAQRVEVEGEGRAGEESGGSDISDWLIVIWATVAATAVLRAAMAWGRRRIALNTGQTVESNSSEKLPDEPKAIELDE